jgi:hypothetical protein
MTNAPQLNARELIDVWFRRLREAQFAHYRATRRYSFFNNALGVAAAVVAAGLGLQLVQIINFAAWFNISTSHFEPILGVSGLFAASLTTFHTFMRYPERAERHLRVAARYSSIRRQIEQAKTLPSDISVTDSLESIRHRLDEAAGDAPDVPAAILRCVQRQLEREGGPGPHLA